MGTFRTLLAIIVIYAHLPITSKFLIGGDNAVQIFYMISGFLITYILNNGYLNIKYFYLNRALRIFPIYWSLAIIMFFLNLIGSKEFYKIFINLPISHNVLLIFSNIFIIGQDWTFFISDQQIHRGLLISPSWTLGIELAFYFLAPFIVRSPFKIISVFLLSISLRIYLISIGLYKDPWNYRFFPSELALFMSGAIAYHYMMKFWNKKLVNYSLPISITLLISFPNWPIQESFKSVCLFLVIFTLIPGLFLIQEKFKVDRKIGELSYPIYICHQPIIKVYCFIIGNPQPEIIVLIVILISFFICKFFDKRLNNLRYKIRQNSMSVKSSFANKRCNSVNTNKLLISDR